MTIDLSQFHGVFFEESFEGLEIMESELLNLDLENPDNESINNIFRAAHSIKGGSGSFGFMEITSFTHVLETFLDEIRNGDRVIHQNELTLLLTSVDILREMMTDARDKTGVDHEQVAAVKHDLERALGQEPSDDESSEIDNAATEQESTVAEWHVSFIPDHHIFNTGNDPLRMFRELEEFCEITSKVDISKLPPFDEHDTEECYLSWDLTLKTDADEARIREVFAWVEDDCKLTVEKTEQVQAIEELSDATHEATASKPEAVPKAEERRDDVGGDRRKNDRRGGADKAAETTSIRVNISKVDALINMVGELVITQSMLSQFGEEFDLGQVEKLSEGLKQLERNTRELQENVMQIRMLPISFSFNRFPRLVHDLGKQLNKKIELKLTGEGTELDKTVMEKIGDPLVHLVRNSIDHGIEMPEERLAAGKPETGIIELKAYHEGGNIVIDIIDDGQGLNKDRIFDKAVERGLIKASDTLTDDKINDLIFRAGFSTAEVVSDVSGRGVGMDVVRRNIHDLGGVVEVKSIEGQGSVFTIRLPLTLAILDGQLIRVGSQVYIIPLVSIIESIQASPEQTKTIANDAELYRLRDDYLPIVRLHSVFNVGCDNKDINNGLLVVVESEGQKIGLFVDDLLAQQQVVIKSLETNYQKVDGVSGATILGDGTVAMILDVSGLIRLYREQTDEKTLSIIDSQAA